MTAPSRLCLIRHLMTAAAALAQASDDPERAARYATTAARLRDLARAPQGPDRGPVVFLPGFRSVALIDLLAEAWVHQYHYRGIEGLDAEVVDGAGQLLRELAWAWPEAGLIDSVRA